MGVQNLGTTAPVILCPDPNYEPKQGREKPFMEKSSVLEKPNQPAERLNGLLRKREIAELLKVSPRTIDKYVTKRLISFIRMNARFNLFRRIDVERALARRTVREDAGL
jgi:hypothetical protein